MDVWNILSTGASTVILLALVHIAVFYVVKTMYPPAPRPQVRFEAPPVVQPQPQAQPQVEAQPIPPEIPLVTTKLPPPVDTRDPGPARPSQPTFSEAAKEKEVVPPSNVPTYESLLSAVSSSKEGFPNLGPMSGPSA
jgi:outer membrane biosynthesis protein TonB